MAAAAATAATSIETNIYQYGDTWLTEKVSGTNLWNMYW
jgi:hypothetical protein